MDEVFTIQMIVKNRLGEFIGKKFTISQQEYDNVISLSKNFYLSGGFELTCQDSFIIFPPDVVKESILIIKKVYK